MTEPQTTTIKRRDGLVIGTWPGDLRSALEEGLKQGANLRDANLGDADLRGAILRDADLGGANLRGANLRGADLRDANLRGANLRDADLGGANLRGANLRGADLGGANLPKTAAGWCEWQEVPVVEGIVTLYKAVGDNWRGPHGGAVTYKPGSVPKAPDWDGGIKECGGGLHFSPRPRAARHFLWDAAHYVACPVRVDEIVVHPNPQFPMKVKAPGCCGPVYEVDIEGERIEPSNRSGDEPKG